VIVEESTAAWLTAHPGAEVTIDVVRSMLALPDGRAVSFPLEAFARHCLLEGLDELGFLLARLPDIEAYERRA
jgi:3-isopropylmalate/(R)-2-methylmalate dehydratase small subunit